MMSNRKNRGNKFKTDKTILEPRAISSCKNCVDKEELSSVWPRAVHGTHWALGPFRNRAQRRKKAGDKGLEGLARAQAEPGLVSSRPAYSDGPWMSSMEVETKNFMNA